MLNYLSLEHVKEILKLPLWQVKRRSARHFLLLRLLVFHELTIQRLAINSSQVCGLFLLSLFLSPVYFPPLYSWPGSVYFPRGAAEARKTESPPPPQIARGNVS